MVLTLAEDLTITTAALTKAALLGALRGPDDVLLDSSAVRAIDLTGLQLLYAAERRASALGKKVAFAGGGGGEVIAHAAAVAGFDKHLASIPGGTRHA